MRGPTIRAVTRPAPTRRGDREAPIGSSGHPFVRAYPVDFANGGVEICDGKDNDCNGSIDDGIAPAATACGVGACGATGTLSCVDGALVDDCQAGNPTGDDSDCDAIDDDCDGSADEHFVEQTTECGVGACGATGTLSCVDGGLVDDCQAGDPTGDDTDCDAIDDDCDGSADEHFVAPSTMCGIGRRDDHEPIEPARPGLAECDPEAAVGVVEVRARPLAPRRSDLLPEGQVDRRSCSCPFGVPLWGIVLRLVPRFSSTRSVCDLARARTARTTRMTMAT